jgi:hypothetical protein
VGGAHEEIGDAFDACHAMPHAITTARRASCRDPR